MHWCMQTLLDPRCVQTDLTHVNILAELYAEAGQWLKVLDLIRDAEQRQMGEDGEAIPVDLQVGARTTHWASRHCSFPRLPLPPCRSRQGQRLRT